MTPLPDSIQIGSIRLQPQPEKVKKYKNWRTEDRDDSQMRRKIKFSKSAKLLFCFWTFGTPYVAYSAFKGYDLDTNCNMLLEAAATKCRFNVCCSISELRPGAENYWGHAN